MSCELDENRATLLTGPTALPLQLATVKDHLNIAPSDTAHDSRLRNLIYASMSTWEHDTNFYIMRQTWIVKLEEFCEYEFDQRPVKAISSIYYYDAANVLTLLPSSVYTLNTSENELELAFLQRWPYTLGRWDAVTITYTVGDHTTHATVPFDIQQALLNYIEDDFEGISGPGNNSYRHRTYERIRDRFLSAKYL